MIGVVLDNPHALSIPALEDEGGVNLELDGGTFFAVALAEGRDGRLFATDRRVAVESGWVLHDPEGDTRWDASTGEVLSGSGAPLQMVAARVQAWFAWYPDFPTSKVWNGD